MNGANLMTSNYNYIAIEDLQAIKSINTVSMQCIMSDFQQAF